MTATETYYQRKIAELEARIEAAGAITLEPGKTYVIEVNDNSLSPEDLNRMAERVAKSLPQCKFVILAGARIARGHGADGYRRGREDAAKAVRAACRMWQCSREETIHYSAAARGDAS